MSDLEKLREIRAALARVAQLAHELDEHTLADWALSRLVEMQIRTEDEDAAAAAAVVMVDA